MWAWATYGLNDDVFLFGNSIESFIEHCAEDNYTFFFHNLKFDGDFIINYLLRNGWKWVKETRDMEAKTFTTLISDMGVWYSIELCHSITKGIRHTTKIQDSLKLLPFSVAQVAKTFDLPISKLELDYETFREVGHELTEHEIDYIRNDVEIMAKALRLMRDAGLVKMTIGSNALTDFKKLYGKKRFEHTFPAPDYDDKIRSAYRGGFTYCNPKFQGKDIGEGIVLDVNSLYPSVMYDCPMPYGDGVRFEGEYEQDGDYPLYVQGIRAIFYLKEGHIPTIQIKNTLLFQPNEYIADTKDEVVTLNLTSVDLQLLKDQYNITYIEYIGGYKFRSCDNAFKEYIDKWNAVKVKATLDGNKGMRQIAKLMLNNLYGKFATNPVAQSKMPVLDEDGMVRYKLLPEEARKPVYIPVGVFITAWARNKTIRSAQAVYDRFLYADTDSLHLIGTDIPDNLDISPTKLGAWKHESTFTRARFLKQKTYVEESEGKLTVTCAGMPYACHQHVTWENFHVGSVYDGKLKQKRVRGGVILEKGEHTIK